jgi:hypothetical protein
MPPKAEVAHNIGAVVDTVFMLTLQSEYSPSRATRSACVRPT